MNQRAGGERRFSLDTASGIVVRCGTMGYKLTTPCGECPFLSKFEHGFTLAKLREFADGVFHCHQTGDLDEESGDYVRSTRSQACAGALIFCERRGTPSQMMRIAERLGVYDRRKLDMEADVR